MAEINNESKGGNEKEKKVKRSKKMSTKIDMTPMVDLAFLLITFFMLTTTFSKPQAMQLNMPDKTKDNQKMKVKESQTLTLILDEKNAIFYYQGLDNPDVKKTDYSSTGIRKVLLQKVKEIKDPIVIIKAKNKAKYKNVVDILDEMNITNIQKYSLIDITEKDLALISKK
jgi:biopolymer transport protein ExbD